VVARDLLTESGSIFVQIGDENVHLVRSVLDEIFGSENFVSLIVFVKTAAQSSVLLPGVCDYLVLYAKDRTQMKYRNLYRDKLGMATAEEAYSWVKFPDGFIRKAKDDEITNPPQGAKLFRFSPLISQNPGSRYDVEFNGKIFRPEPGWWKTDEPRMQKIKKVGRLHPSGKTLFYRLFLDDFPCVTYTNLWTDTQASFGEKTYVVQTSTKVIERCMAMTTDPGDLVLDPTCGSGTSAYVAEQWGRRWITIDTSRVAIALARTRLMAGRFPYYLLADSYEGRKKERELNPLILGETTEITTEVVTTESTGDIKRGFVYKRVPHVTLKSIANNEEIDAIHEKYQPPLEELWSEINTVAGQKWEEWEIPRAGATRESPLLQDYWNLRRARQKEIDTSIARRADTEFLYDQPYEEPKRIRVSGPFTVESLSPHRVLAPDDPSTALREDALNTTDFAGMIIENLRTSGVQNTIKNERLKFDRLEAYAGAWIHAAGEYTEKDGKSRRVAVSIGPELGTVGPEQVKEAAKEAVMGIGFDVLIVCGFAFDPHVSEEAKRYGKLTVLPAHMNPDLAMGDELLKKTGAGNLFMVFGEPDLEIEKKDGKISIHLKGLDVYDPTTGEVRSNSTDDIACWFIDTDYNEETFIVRHAYFTGADQPYEKLQRALRAEIDESAWSALYSTTSYPFEKPETGKIAVKVINHYGDEVLKVYEVK
jgi:adenine-specific DNA-methyltransferase